MKEDNLKDIVTQICNNVLDNINTYDNPSKEQITNDLTNALKEIYAVSEEKIRSIEKENILLTNSYKNVAKSSIVSYKSTNENFEKFSNQHKKIIHEENNLIDYSSIKEKFDALHNDMEKEINRANEHILKLTDELQELEKSSNLDSLTKTLNRHALDTYLQSVCNRKKLSNELHLLMLDIDDFKVVNDTYGHIAGDKLLIYISKVLSQTLRDGDKLFRYGGEEFVIILNRVESKICLEIAQRILNTISSSRLIYKGTSLLVTLSIGTTKYYDGDTPDAILERADKALYRSKKSGKNQINVEKKDEL